jgi:hypothetical protein
MSALRKLQHRADDLAKCLLILELDLQRSRTLNRRMEAFHDYARIVDYVDVLRRDAEVFLTDERLKDQMLARLDKKTASVMRSPAYRVAEWFSAQCVRLGWMIGPACIDPLQPATQS